MKKVPKLIGVTNNPVLIVGEKMGKQRPGQDTYALEGNRTGDFVHEAIGNKTNIILTNVVNYYYDAPFKHNLHVGEGVADLIELIETHKPCKIICLGAIAEQYVKSIKGIDCPIVCMPHPSYINRFKSKFRSIYIKFLTDEINNRVPADTELGRP